ncbi:hypothetical protein D3C84_618400 [compost metagenome]
MNRVDRFGGNADRTLGRTHLSALQRVRIGVLPCSLGMPQALETDMQSRRVHHHEHRGQTTVRLADQPTLGAVEDQRARGTALDAHLVFDTVAAQRIGLAVIQALGHQKQRNTTTTSGRPRQARQHQMQDVLGQVMFASGNEQLAAAQPITAVALGFGTAAQQADVAAGLGFGQAHGGQRLATDDLRQITLLDPLRRMGLEAQVSAMGDPRVHGPGVVAGV